MSDTKKINTLIKKMVFDTLFSLSEVNPEYQFNGDSDSKLLGPDSKLDSLGIVHLLVNLPL